MIVLGIDPALNNCGFSLVKYEKQKDSFLLLNSGTIKTKSQIAKVEYKKLQSDPFYDKLNVILDILQEQIDLYKPHKLAIEDNFVSVDSKSSLKLSMIRGAIIGLCLKNNMLIQEYMPNQVKKTVTGNGKADKEQVSFMIGKIFNNLNDKKMGYDETDAIAIAITGCLM